MLVKFFQYGAVKKGQKGHSGGGGAVKNYLLGKNFDKGEIREGATLFRGDPNETTSIINGIERQSYYKSGVISFTNSDSRKLNDDQLNEIIDSFEATMFPNLEPDQYSGYWVKHEDKGRKELHFVYAEEELTSGYGLNVYVATIDKPLVDSWKDLTNDKYDLDDPNAPDHKRERTVTKGFELKKGFEYKDGRQLDESLKDEIEKKILAYDMLNPLNIRDDVLKAFEHFGYKVTSKPKSKYISIEHPNKKDNPELKNLRFKSDLYSLDFNRSMLKTDKSYEQREYERKRPERIAKAKKIYDSSLQKRIERMNHRYRNVERKPLDNQLTHDLDQIRVKSEPNFLKQVAEYQRQELKKIIGQTIEQIYKQHEHDQPEQLATLKNLHQILIDDIDNQVKDEPLPHFDEIIEKYANAKNHIVTVDTIEHDRQQAQLEQQRQDRLELLASFHDYTLTEYGIEQLEGMDYQALLDLQNEYETWLQSVDDYARNHDIEPYIENYQYYRATLNYLHESNLVEQKRIEAERPPEPQQTAGQGIVRSDEEVVQLTPEPTTAPYLDHPEPEKITLNQRQQIVYDIALKYFDENDPEETKNDIAKLDDSELRAFENPYQDEHDEYVKLANSYAKSMQDNLIKKSEIELSKLKTLVPERPDHTKMSAKAWDKAFEKWNSDRILPEANVRAKDIEINNLKNQTVRATPIHFEKIAKDRPDLASNEQEYKHFEQFINEVNRALTELDRQPQNLDQVQVKNSGMDK